MGNHFAFCLNSFPHIAGSYPAFGFESHLVAPEVHSSAVRCYEQPPSGSPIWVCHTLGVSEVSLHRTRLASGCSSRTEKWNVAVFAWNFTNYWGTTSPPTPMLFEWCLATQTYFSFSGQPSTKNNTLPTTSTMPTKIVPTNE